MVTLPDELYELSLQKRWVCHKGKVPMNPYNGGNAKSNDPSTWGTYAEAASGVERFAFDGIGLQFGLKSDAAKWRLSGIDLDHVVRENGTLEPFAQEIVERMNTYTEYSPSKTGLHILCYTNLPDIGKRRKIDENCYNENCALEMYNNSRYFTVTGNAYGIARPVANRTFEYQAINDKYFTEKPKTTEISAAKAIVSTPDTLNDEGDEALLEKMFHSSNGESIKRLFHGDTSDYTSPSEADLALCWHLVFWTGRDVKLMDRLFRRSGLMRDKWNKESYRERTIQKALETQPNTYDPDYRSDTQIQEEYNLTSLSTQLTQPTLPLKRTIGRDVTDYLNNAFSNDRARFAKLKERKTGYSNIDKLTSLYPGLYILGAITSLGKTTFAHQMADQLAEAGEHVLYFSLEQSMFELVCKGLSRITAKIEQNSALTAIQIREDIDAPIVQKAMEEYSTIALHHRIYECGFDTTVEEIIEHVQEYIKDSGVKPVVFIDCLQIIRPLENRTNTKDAVDNHVRVLKKLQVENDLVGCFCYIISQQAKLPAAHRL